MVDNGATTRQPTEYGEITVACTAWCQRHDDDGELGFCTREWAGRNWVLTLSTGTTDSEPGVYLDVDDDGLTMVETRELAIALASAHILADTPRWTVPQASTS